LKNGAPLSPETLQRSVFLSSSFPQFPGKGLREITESSPLSTVDGPRQICCLLSWWHWSSKTVFVPHVHHAHPYLKIYWPKLNAWRRRVTRS